MPEALIVKQYDHTRSGEINYRGVIRDLERKKFIKRVSILDKIVWARYYLPKASIRTAYYKLLRKKGREKIRRAFPDMLK